MKAKKRHNKSWTALPKLKPWTEETKQKAMQSVADNNKADLSFPNFYDQLRVMRAAGRK